MMIKLPKKLRVWVVIFVAACLFFLAMSSVTLGIIEVIQNDLVGIWFVSVGIMIHIMAILIALRGGRRPKNQFVNS